ncbi:membrane dipeptidase [Flammeovirga aprica]|uniref:Peptidase M19 n=1 Tax=Flammeovirga aprica JL-4 TaxID=694437 RepID=A0A7X9RZY0_9BACT|nr:membrane dipeptidase [Flammeovirga aprica]NME71806.1 peptidase M19 [Flammeovirga aprica JL-4]
MPNKFYVDLHCHPSLKPLGKSFNSNSTKGKNSNNHKNNNSLYHKKKPHVVSKLFNIVTTMTKFTQTDLQTLADGNVHVIGASLYTMEKGFVINKLKTGIVCDALSNLAMGIGKKRIDNVQEHQDYFSDLELEYNFYKQLDNQLVDVKGKKVKYKLAKSYQELAGLKEEQNDFTTIYIVLSIEGMHALNTGLNGENSQCDEEEVLRNLDTIKNWEHPIFFVTLAHHFWNELCGQAPSLSGIVGWATDQEHGLDSSITPLGYKVIDKLLDDSTNRRMLIDMKHMNNKSRKAYYQYLSKYYALENIPLIVSHGALNGLKSHENPVNEISIGKQFLAEEINFYDDEIIRIVESGGIFCFQLDERRLIDDPKNIKKGWTKHQMKFNQSLLLWKQIQHFVEVLNARGHSDIWDNMAIGSDFDGVVNPLNGFWTGQDYASLLEYLTAHASSYLKSAQCPLMDQNKIDASEAIDKIFRWNALRFMEVNFSVREEALLV